MGFLKKLFGGNKEPDRPAASRPAAPMPSSASTRSTGSAGPGGSSASPTDASSPEADAGGTSIKQLSRELGSGNPERREAAARQMVELYPRTALRPLMNAYLNYGDPGVLESMKVFGKDLAVPASRDAFDLSVMGDRRARLMDMIGISGEESALPSVRPGMDDPDLDIHIRSCVAAARLGDLFGVDKLEEDIRMVDTTRRAKALAALVELDTERSHRVLADHVKRYMSEAGAVPESVTVKAPLLEAPDLTLPNMVVQEVRSSPQNLVMIIGSGGIQLATSRRDQITEALKDWGPVHLGLPLMTPEEQIANLQAAHAAATARPDARAAFLGRLPAPHDSPPLPHFIKRVEGVSYTVKIIIVDLHEYNLLQDWLHYVQDRAEVPTEIEVIQSLSLQGQSALSKEEQFIYQLCSPEDKARFARAYLAHS